MVKMTQTLWRRTIYR